MNRARGTQYKTNLQSASRYSLWLPVMAAHMLCTPRASCGGGDIDSNGGSGVSKRWSVVIDFPSAYFGTICYTK